MHGLDNISMGMLKICGESICVPLEMILNNLFLLVSQLLECLYGRHHFKKICSLNKTLNNQSSQCLHSQFQTSVKHMFQETSVAFYKNTSISRILFSEYSTLSLHQVEQTKYDYSGLPQPKHIQNCTHTRWEKQFGMHSYPQRSQQYLTRLRIGVSHPPSRKFKREFVDVIALLCSCGVEIV